MEISDIALWFFPVLWFVYIIYEIFFGDYTGYRPMTVLLARMNHRHLEDNRS